MQMYICTIHNHCVIWRYVLYKGCLIQSCYFLLQSVEEYRLNADEELRFEVEANASVQMEVCLCES